MKLLLFFALWVGCANLQAQHDPEKLFWKEDPLTWEDFQAPVDKRSSFQANTNAGLSYSWGVRNENGIVSLQYEVLSFFNPHLSWVVPTSKSEYLLSHEQLHFDITELHARKLRQHLAQVSIDELGKNPKEVLNSFYTKVEKERTAMQLNYDKETNHSLNKEAEAKWQQFVKTELKKLKDYRE